MRVTATVQARTGSSRLPGKVLMPIGGRPMLARQIERIRRSRLVDDIVIATTTSPADDAIADLAADCGVGVYRGSEDDVLGRIAGLLAERDVDIHVELIGDSPFTDPQIVDETIGFYLKNMDTFDYVANGMRVTYPSGMEVSVYKGSLLVDIEAGVAADDPMREHVEVHLTRNAALRRCNLAAPAWFLRPDLFLEVDTPKDLDMVTQVFGHFDAAGASHFGLAQILEFLDDHPEVGDINRRENRTWWDIKPDLSGIYDSELGQQ